MNNFWNNIFRKHLWYSPLNRVPRKSIQQYGYTGMQNYELSKSHGDEDYYSFVTLLSLQYVWQKNNRKIHHVATIIQNSLLIRKICIFLSVLPICAIFHFFFEKVYKICFIRTLLDKPFTLVHKHRNSSILSLNFWVS